MDWREALAPPWLSPTLVDACFAIFMRVKACTCPHHGSLKHAEAVEALLHQGSNDDQEASQATGCSQGPPFTKITKSLRGFLRGATPPT